MHSFYRDPARRPMVMSSGAVACLAAPEMPCRKGRRSAASESCRLRRDEDARPHIARNSGLFTFWRRAGAHLRFSRKFWFGWQAAGRQAGFRSGWRAQAAHSPFARSSRSAAAQSGSAEGFVHVFNILQQHLVALRCPIYCQHLVGSRPHMSTSEPSDEADRARTH